MRVSFPTPDAGYSRIESDYFGLSPHEDIQVLDTSPRTGQLVRIEFRGEECVARYRGRYVDLPDGSATRVYRLIGVLNRLIIV